MKISDLEQAIDRRSEVLRTQASAAIVKSVAELEQDLQSKIRSLRQNCETTAACELHFFRDCLQKELRSALNTTAADIAADALKQREILKQVLDLRHPWVWILSLSMIFLLALGSLIWMQLDELRGLAASLEQMRLERSLYGRVTKTTDGLWIRANQTELVQGKDGQLYLVIRNL